MEYNGDVIVNTLDSVWRGKFEIAERDIYIDVAAYLNSTSSAIVENVAKTMPDNLELEVFEWRDVWTEWFDCEPPPEFSVHVLFFSKGRDEDRLASLLNDVMSTDFALKAKMGEVELLIFNSCFLPEKIQRYEGKLYLWGVFMGEFDEVCHNADSDAREMLSLPLKSGNINPVQCMDGPMQIPKETGALKKHPAMGKNCGRRLDDGWSHAKPLDEGRKKSECKYCNFISKHGGISRLKAHLAGGGPRLQGCHKVPTDVKIAMTEWFTEWIKDAKTYWVKEFHMAAEDDVWKHATRLDEKGEGYQTKCMYCGFVSNRRGTKEMRVHLAGNPAKNLEGCPDAPPDVKTLMSKGISKKKKGTKREIVEMELQEDEKTSETQEQTTEATSSLNARGIPDRQEECLNAKNAI